jgi:hypothetical protein
MTTLTTMIRVAAAASAIVLSGSAFSQDADAIRGKCINDAMAAYSDPGIYEHQRARTQLYINCMRSNGLNP